MFAKRRKSEIFSSFVEPICKSSILFAVALVVGCSPSQTFRLMDTNHAAATDFIQGWNLGDRRLWSRASGGSRLIPLKWLTMLEFHDSENRIINYLAGSAFGYLQDDETSINLPFGFAIDQQQDQEFRHTGFRWYAKQGGSRFSLAEPWVGLTCGACHTNRCWVRLLQR